MLTSSLYNRQCTLFFSHCTCVSRDNLNAKNRRMKASCYRYRKVVPWLLTIISERPWVVDAQDQPSPIVHVEEACAEFFSGGNSLSGWRHSDCVDVWTSWFSTVPNYVYGPFPQREMLAKVAGQLRGRGLPCLVQSGAYNDGVGSTAMRHLASWMFSEEIGCDWVTPHWRKTSVDSQGTIMYCHGMYSVAEVEEIRLGKAVRDPGKTRCMLYNWVEYFNLPSHSTTRPTNSTIRVVQVRLI